MTRGGDIRFLIDTLFNVRYLRLSQGRHQRATFVYTITAGCRFPYSSSARSMSHTQHSRRLVGEMVFTRNNDNTG